MPSPPGAITRRCACASLLGSWRPWLPGPAASLEEGSTGRLDGTQDSGSQETGHSGRHCVVFRVVPGATAWHCACAGSGSAQGTSSQGLQ